MSNLLDSNPDFIPKKVEIGKKAELNSPFNRVAVSNPLGQLSVYLPGVEQKRFYSR